MDGITINRVFFKNSRNYNHYAGPRRNNYNNNNNGYRNRPQLVIRKQARQEQPFTVHISLDQNQRTYGEEYEEENYISTTDDFEDEEIQVTIVHDRDQFIQPFASSTTIAELIVRYTEHSSIVPTKILLGKYTARHQINPEVIPLSETVGDHFTSANQTVRVVPMPKGLCSWETGSVSKSEVSFNRDQLLLKLEASVHTVYVLDSNVIITSQNRKNYLSQRLLEHIVGTKMLAQNEVTLVVTESAMNDLSFEIPQYLQVTQWNSLMPTVFKNQMALKVEEALKDNEDNKKLWDSMKRADNSVESRALGLYIEAILLQKALGYSKKGKHEVVVISENLKFKRFFVQNAQFIANLAAEWLGADILPPIASSKELIQREPYSSGITFKDDLKCFRCCGVGHERKKCTLPDNWVFKFGSDCPGCLGRNHTIDQCPSNESVRYCWQIKHESLDGEEVDIGNEQEPQSEIMEEAPTQYFANSRAPLFAQPQRIMNRRYRN